MIPLPRCQRDDHSRSMGLAPAAVCCGHLPASRQDVNTTRKGYSHALAGSSPSHAFHGLVDECSLVKLGAGFGRRPFPHSSSAEVISSGLSVIARPLSARGGCLFPSLSGSRQISVAGRMERGFARSSVFRRFHTFPKISQHVLQDLADRSECHFVKSLSVCGWRGNTQPRERGQNLGTVSRPESH